MRNTRVHALVESAVLFAVAYVLSVLRQFEMPQGGSVTILSMLPLLLIGIRRGPVWGLSAAFLYGGFQTLPPAGMGIPALFAWTKTPAAFFAALALDYILAFGVLGLSFLFRRSARALLYAVPVCLTLRFLCHLVSGVVIWSEYAGDMNVWLYSLIYNGSFMGIELVFTMAAAFALWKTAPRLVTGSYIE